MSDIAKWAIMLAIFVGLIALIVALPIFSIINIDELTSAVSTIVTYTSNGIQAARGLFNNFCFPAMRVALTTLIIYRIVKVLLVWTVKITVIAVSWIFK